MPTTLIGLIIIVFALLPGIPAQHIIYIYLGSDWRKSETDKIVNVILISTMGLILYILFASIFSLPMPIYVIPSTFDKASFNTSILLPIAISFIGHLIASLLVSVIYIWVSKKILKKYIKSTRSAAWDDFINDEIQDHWVIISLVNEQAYAGYIKRADTSVCQTERDIILLEPAKYHDKKKKFISTSLQHMFIPASNIYSISSLYNEDKDVRITDINQILFEE